MTEMNVLALESLELERIREIIRSSGPCVTLLLPAYRAGEQSKPIAAIIRSDLQKAARQLVQRHVPESIKKNLLEPLEQLAEESSEGCHWGRVIFRSPDTFRQFAVTQPIKPSIQVGGCFEITPILSELHTPPEFFLLRLSKKNVEVFRCAGLHATRVKLPGGVPETLEEALGFKAPDHDLENRAAAGSSVGAMHAIRFGTGSGREMQGAYLADFYKAVDRGIHELLGTHDAPMVLAGVDEDTVLYRSSSSYPNLLARNVHASTGASVDHDMLLEAHSIVRSDCDERAIHALLGSKERLAPARYSTSVNDILRSAAEGRVASLYIDEVARKFGAFDSVRGGSWKWNEEDLLNIAAVETLLQGGQAFRLPAGSIPDGAMVAAILRF